MKAYSSDLRHRVLEAYTRGEGSIRTLGERFSIHWRTVSNWVSRLNKTNSMDPVQQRYGPLPKINDGNRDVIHKLIDSKPDSTLHELKERFQEITGESISKNTVWRALQKSGLTRKKKRHRLAKQIHQKDGRQ